MSHPDSSRAEAPWVFAYGSLLWNPGFSFLEVQRARVTGYHRSLCIYSHVHRGTAERPGLVLGLDRGGSCLGAAYRVDPIAWSETIAYLREREQVTAIYREARLRVSLEGGEQVSAIAYIVDRKHSQYAGKLPHDAILTHVAQGVGQSGANSEYVLNTQRRLTQMGIRDHVLERVAARFASFGDR
ncbi:MAG: ChaC family protein [Hyphomicrobiales bacterium]|jgi:cation transport protein ChaC|nr:ChaC family protein [Hyphomicrobiales bacterium]